jgi:hypothetical protein
MRVIAASVHRTFHDRCFTRSRPTHKFHATDMNFTPRAETARLTYEFGEDIGVEA